MRNRKRKRPNSFQPDSYITSMLVSSFFSPAKGRSFFLYTDIYHRQETAGRKKREEGDEGWVRVKVEKWRMGEPEEGIDW